MNNPSSKNRRLALMISGSIDALIGAALLLIGFHLLPVEVTRYGLQSWQVSVLGAVMFLLGAGIFAYSF